LPILVVIADPAYRELVRRLLEELGQPAMLVASWREAIAEITDPPTLIVADLDDIGRSERGLEALERAGWGENVPLIVMSYGNDFQQRADSLGAAAAFRKPLVIGKFMETIARLAESAKS